LLVRGPRPSVARSIARAFKKKFYKLRQSQLFCQRLREQSACVIIIKMKKRITPPLSPLLVRSPVGWHRATQLPTRQSWQQERPSAHSKVSSCPCLLSTQYISSIANVLPNPPTAPPDGLNLREFQQQKRPHARGPFFQIQAKLRSPSPTRVYVFDRILARPGQKQTSSPSFSLSILVQPGANGRAPNLAKGCLALVLNDARHSAHKIGLGLSASQQLECFANTANPAGKTAGRWRR